MNKKYVFAEVLSPQKWGPQIANCKERVGIRNSAYCHIFGRSAILTNFKSANLRICDLQNLFTDRPPLCIPEVYYTRGPTFHSFGFWLENTFRGILMSILYHREITSRFVHLVNQILHETSLCANTMYFLHQDQNYHLWSPSSNAGMHGLGMQAHTCSFLKEVF